MQVAPGSPLSALLGIMERTEDAMLAVPPCNDNPDSYFAAAVQPHRQVLKLCCPKPACILHTQQ